MGSSASPGSLCPLTGQLPDSAGGRCDDVTCIKSGHFKVTCYLCFKVFHSGCAGLPDRDYKVIRCCEAVLGPNGFTRVPNQNKVRCSVCRRKFFKMYARITGFEKFTCVPCITNTPADDSSS